VSTTEFNVTVDGEEVMWTKGDIVIVKYMSRDGKSMLEAYGKLITVRDGEAYVDTELGPVVGYAETLEKVSA